MADPFTDATTTIPAGAQPDFATSNYPIPSITSASVTASNTNAFTTNTQTIAAKPLPQIEGLSESTQALLKRVGQSHNFSTGSPEWEKAREEVMKRMSSTTNSNFPPVATKRGGASLNGSTHTADTQDATLVTPKRGRGRPPGRPRASGRGGRPGRPRGSRGSSRARGGKRKRDEDDDEEDGDGSDTGSDVSASYTPQATVTKSGRNVQKPTQFVPAAVEMSPSSSTKRKRPYLRKNAEITQLCAKCSRGHSPLSNMVVFCDGCNLAYHQWCHDPHIPRDVVDVAEKEWFCSRCKSQQELERLPIDQRVSGQNLTEDEQKQHLSSLAHPTLVRLLLRATSLHPDLPIFAPDAREALRSRSSSLSPIPNHVDGLDGGNDPYPDYSNPDNDPPATYPRPGMGPFPLQATTDPERLQWLVDDNFDVYSHSYDDGSGTGLKPVDRSKGDDWIQHADGGTRKEDNGDMAYTNGQHTNSNHEQPFLDATHAHIEDHAKDLEHDDDEDEIDIGGGPVGDIDMGIFVTSMP